MLRNIDVIIIQPRELHHFNKYINENHLNIEWLCGETLLGCVHLINFEITEFLVIFGIEKNVVLDSVVDLIILLSKYHIFRCKLSNSVPSLNHFKHIFKRRYFIEKDKALIPKIPSVTSFEEQWRHYMFLIE